MGQLSSYVLASLYPVLSNTPSTGTLPLLVGISVGKKPQDWPDSCQESHQYLHKLKQHQTAAVAIGLESSSS